MVMEMGMVVGVVMVMVMGQKGVEVVSTLQRTEETARCSALRSDKR